MNDEGVKTRESVSRVFFFFTVVVNGEEKRKEKKEKKKLNLKGVFETDFNSIL